MNMLKGQVIPLEFEFQEVNPLWVHTVVDTTFIPIPDRPNVTQYSNQFITSMSLYDDQLILLSASSENLGWLRDDYGFVLEKLDIKNGEAEWNHHSTYNSGGEQDFYQRVHFSPQGSIELVGLERYGPADGGIRNWTLGGHHSKSSLKSLDPETGVLKNHVQAQDSIHYTSFSCRHYNIYPMIHDSLYLAAIMVGKDVGSLGSPIYDYGITYKVLDKHFEVLDTSRHLFDFDDLGPFSIDQPAFMRELNDQTLVSLAYKDRAASLDSNEIQLMWTDISDPFNIRTTNIIDYGDLIPGSDQTFRGLSFKTIDNTIFLSHLYPNFDLQEFSAYILWLTAEGEVKTFIDLPYHEDHLYVFTDIFYSNDDFAYLLAYPSHTGRRGYDIIKILDGSDTLQLVSSLTSNNQDEQLAIGVAEVYQDEFVMIGGSVSLEDDPLATARNLYCFKAEDLGLSFDPVSVTETEGFQNFEIFPNPASDILNFNCSGCLDESDYEISIYSQLGYELISHRNSSSWNSIDVTSLESGLYIIEILEKKSKIRHSERFSVLRK